MNRRTVTFALAIFSFCQLTLAQKKVINDINTPLHLMQPNYETPYKVPDVQDVKADIDRVLSFMAQSMPTKDDSSSTAGRLHKGVYDDCNKLPVGAFRLTSYEAGVLYNATLSAAKATGDNNYMTFAADRLNLIANLAPRSIKGFQTDKNYDSQMRPVVNPQALDDAGAMCAAFIRLQLSNTSSACRLHKAQKCDCKKADKAVKEVIERYADYVMNKQMRLNDGLLARNRPHKNSVWLDDMYMGIPCLAWYGRLTGNTKYYDEALRQLRLFKQRMWVPEQKLFRHGWIEAMNPHPCFPWGRANGWAILTMCEVLDAIPTDYPGREEVLDLLRQHIEGLCAVQDKTGFWHQLLDRNDTYLETSATAIFTYCMSHAICEGWIDALAYGSQTLQGWQATATKINNQGQVEGTCVGSGMGFDAAFYSYRPVHVMALHGYGPVIWAGSEVIRMLNATHPKFNDSAIHFYSTPQTTASPIFNEQ